jgi:uncharacterized protein (TIGR03382 family)
MNWLAAAAAAAMILGAGSAHASYVVSVTVDGGGAGKTGSQTFSGLGGGLASFSFFSGSLKVSASTSSAMGANNTYLFTTTTDVDNSTSLGHTVVLQVTETGFTLPTAPVALSADVGTSSIAAVSKTAATGSKSKPGVTPAASFSLQGFLADTSNTYQTGVYSASLTAPNSPFNAADLGGTVTSPSNPINNSIPFSLTEKIGIKVGDNTSATTSMTENVDAVTPEPTTMLLAFSALPLVGWGLWRRRQARA